MPLDFETFSRAAQAGNLASAGLQLSPDADRALRENPAYREQFYAWWQSTGQAPADLRGPAATPAQPSASQPASGQPGPVQPASGQPSYRQPGPAQPSYGQPVAGPNAYTPGAGGPYGTGNAYGPGSTANYGGGSSTPLPISKRPGFGQLIGGVVLAVIGLIITVGTFFWAPDGHTYITYGPVIVGVALIIRGAVALNRSR